MPLTVATPLDDQVFGPGFRLTVTTDLLGPWPTGTRYQATLTPTGVESTVQYASINYVSTPYNISWTFGRGTLEGGVGQETWIFLPRQSAFPHGATGALRIYLLSGVSTLHESLAVPVVFDFITGMWELLLTRITSGFGASFGSADRVKLDDILAAVYRPFPESSD